MNQAVEPREFNDLILAMPTALTPMRNRARAILLGRINSGNL